MLPVAHLFSYIPRGDKQQFCSSFFLYTERRQAAIFKQRWFITSLNQLGSQKESTGLAAPIAHAACSRATKFAIV